MEFLNVHKFEIVLTFLLSLSEVLSFSDKIKANGVFQLIRNGIIKAKDLINK